MLQPQIVQSPARLGLTNPSSPSLQNPIPPKLPSHQQNSQTITTTTTSSALLPLLPPLPRAQALLVQMASLGSKLFDVSSNRAHWLSAFRGNLPTFLSSQCTSPSPLSSSSSSAKEILSLFNSLQTQLVEAVSELQEILDLQDAKQKIVREIRSKDTALLNFAHKLKEAELHLDILVDEYSDYRHPKRLKQSTDDDVGVDKDLDGNTTLSSKIKLSDILSYAHKISYTTFAPPELPGQPPRRGALPPAPQEEQMRASQLYAFADLDVGLPKAAEPKERAIDAIVEPPPPPQQLGEANPLTNFPAIQGLLPPNITVPSGWKPGMPVELPMDLPVPPPGWKPGDPLPPLESLPVPRIPGPPMLPASQQPIHKPPGTIQVRHVQIDILDQDDDSSDYSSDEASSDDED